MSEQQLTPEQKDTLRSAIPYKLPYCSGTRELPAESCFLFYKKDGDARCLDLLHATAAELAHLQSSCDPATFGLNKEDVLDESYRKAGKLDPSQFAMTFDFAGSRILNLVQDDLLEGQSGGRPIVPELYKLNVYGEGSFFKEHKDTPRGEDMFGSLVIVLPTPHEGGALILRQEGREWTFDSGKEIAARPQEPFVSYVAFYGDVDHEVLPVLSGYRITVTYNLYFGDKQPIAPRTSAEEENIRAALLNLIDDPLFLPQGGALGFGLRHLYPVTSYSGKMPYQKVTHLKSFVDRLKGSDAILARACAGLALQVSVHVVYKVKYYGAVMCDSLVDPSDLDMQGAYEMLPILGQAGGVFIYDSTASPDANMYARSFQSSDVSEQLMRTKDVEWITEVTPFNVVPEKYISYGNQAERGELYGDLCVIVEIGEPATRSTLLGNS